MHEIINCPNCNAALSNWEQKERECFTCQWSEAIVNDTMLNVPTGFQWDKDNQELEQG